jgi:hypothetical protein
MLFGWRVVKHVKSNAIVYAGADRTLGTGAGQMSRVDASRIAVWKAGEAKLSLKGSVVCSDAFFPFPDGLIAAAEAGARRRSSRAVRCGRGSDRGGGCARIWPWRSPARGISGIKQRGLDWLMVDHDQGLRCRRQRKTLLPPKFKRQVLTPGAVVIQLQIVSTVTADTERKTADRRLAARLFSRQDMEFNHQKIRRGT